MRGLSWNGERMSRIARRLRVSRGSTYVAAPRRDSLLDTAVRGAAVLSTRRTGRVVLRHPGGRSSLPEDLLDFAAYEPAVGCVVSPPGLRAPQRSARALQLFSQSQRGYRAVPTTVADRRGFGTPRSPCRAASLESHPCVALLARM